MAMHQVGAAVFANPGGVVRMEFGDYFLADIASGTICIGAALLVLRIRRSRHVPMRPALAGT